MKKVSLYLNILLALALVVMAIHLVQLKQAVAEATTVTEGNVVEPADTLVVEESSDTMAVVEEIVSSQPEVAEEAVTETPVPEKAKPAPTEKPVTKPADKAVEKTEEKVETVQPAAPVVQVINTTDLAADVRGYVGATPVEITIEDGRVKSVRPLPNDETPNFFLRLTESGLFRAWDGLSVSEAKSVHVDAVTGATFSSKAVIENVRRGLDAAK
ncbi:MAG: FMN-binding protein [Bacteroidaceae bacterium]|nr:FMN-binding protein [Bacteroidaceae bacterium]